MNFVIFILMIALAKFVFNIGWQLLLVALEQIGLVASKSNKEE